MKERITYRNRIEVKILSIAIAIIWGILYTIILVGDLRTQSPHFWHNQMSLLIMLFIFCVPIVIIGRYKIIFDYKNRQITHIPYFRPKKQYRFDELYVSIERRKTGFLTWEFIFTKDGKRLFRISDVDFAHQTRKSADHLKELLQGDAKFVYDLERSIKQEGFLFTPYSYSLSEVIGSVSSIEWHQWITIRYQAETKFFTLQVWKIEIHKDTGPKEYIIEEDTTDADALIQSILELAYRYLWFHAVFLGIVKEKASQVAMTREAWDYN